MTYGADGRNRAIKKAISGNTIGSQGWLYERKEQVSLSRVYILDYNNMCVSDGGISWSVAASVRLGAYQGEIWILASVQVLVL